MSHQVMNVVGRLEAGVQAHWGHTGRWEQHGRQTAPSAGQPSAASGRANVVNVTGIVAVAFSDVAAVAAGGVVADTAAAAAG